MVRATLCLSVPVRMEWFSISHESEGEIPDSVRVADFEERYHKILQTAADEYTYEPPSDYYRDGYNLSQRMSKFAENHLLFLHNILVPTTNNLAERLLRCFKRKQKQAMSFRSDKNIEYLCSLLYTSSELQRTCK